MPARANSAARPNSTTSEDAIPHSQAQANAGGRRTSESRLRENRTHGSMRGSRGTTLGEMVRLTEALDSERARNGLANAPSLLGAQRSCSLLYTTAGRLAIGRYSRFVRRCGVLRRFPPCPCDWSAAVQLKWEMLTRGHRFRNHRRDSKHRNHCRWVTHPRGVLFAEGLRTWALDAHANSKALPTSDFPTAEFDELNFTGTKHTA